MRRTLRCNRIVARRDHLEHDEHEPAVSRCAAEIEELDDEVAPAVGASRGTGAADARDRGDSGATAKGRDGGDREMAPPERAIREKESVLARAELLNGEAGA